MIRLPRACAGLMLLAIGGCAFGRVPPSHTDRATEAACRSYASQVYDRNNRGDIYRIDQTGLPNSSSYQIGSQNNVLANRYANEKLVDDCIRNTGTETNRGNEAPAPASSP